MSSIPENEKQRRHQSVASTLGTHAMEGLFPDEATKEILSRYEAGELSLEQFSVAMDDHAKTLLAARPAFAGAA